MNILNNASEYEMEFQAVDTTSSKMKTAIQKWFDLYFQAEATKDFDSCQRVPFTIVRKLTKTAFAEYSASSEDQFVSGVLDALNAKKLHSMQMALIGGECGLKPVPTNKGFRFTVMNRNKIMVFARDADGNMMDIGTAEQSVSGRYYYTLLERRRVEPDGRLTITNRLYESQSKTGLGNNVPLSTLPQYAALKERHTFDTPMGGVGIAWLKTPVANCVDGGADCVSVYAAAVGLIENINRNEAQINGEFERGQSRIIVAADMMEIDETGKPKKLTANVFTALDEDIKDVGINIFSPQLREGSFLALKTEYLRNIESIIGLKRGLLSEVEAAERTAKEITSSEGDYSLTIIDFQNAWEDAVREACRICGILGQMYNVPGAHEISGDDISFDWGNGVLYDEEATWADMKDQVARGLLKPEIALGWRYGMPYETEADLKKIRQKYMPVAVEDGEA